MTNCVARVLQTLAFTAFLAPLAAFAQQTTPADREAFLAKYSGVGTAMGVASFCENASNVESLKALLVSSAVDANLHRGKGMYDAVRELMEPVFAHVNGVAAGLQASHISGAGKDAVCREGAEVAARMITPRKP